MGTDEKTGGRQLLRREKRFKYGWTVFVVLLLIGGFAFAVWRAAWDEPAIDNPDFRVVIKTNEFAEVFHPAMEVSAAGGMTISFGEESLETAAGEKEKFTPDDSRFEEGEGKIRITAKDGGEIGRASCRERVLCSV